jgi:hypothetical protein
LFGCGVAVEDAHILVHNKNGMRHRVQNRFVQTLGPRLARWFSLLAPVGVMNHRT